MTLAQLFTSIANAIRSKRGTSATIQPTNFPSNILAISSGGDESEYVQQTDYSALLDGKYGYYPPEMCEALMTGNYNLEVG